MSISDTNRRCVALSGQNNFRDLGGHRARDGRTVRWGQIYRSGELSALSDEDVERLAELGLRTVVDLRSAAEMESKGPDRLPPGAEVLSLTIDPGDLSPIVGPAFATGDFSHIPADLLGQINRAYVRDCTDQLRTLLSIALDPANRPLVFHCTQGKDRAGISAAILLSALGVPWDGVIEDYLLSNAQRHESATAGLRTLRKQSARKRGVEVEEVDITHIRGLFFVDATYLGAARGEMHELYGSIESFVGDGLRWSDTELTALRNELLE
jgi:protein-tyrosine phosphatase